MNEIKKKTKNREIKSKGKIIDVRKHIKNIAIHSKANSNTDEKETQNTYAVDHVSKNGKKAINNVKEQSIKNAKKQYVKRKKNKIIERQNQNVYTPTPSSSSQHKSDKAVSENNTLNKRKTVQKDLKIKKYSKSLPIKNKNIAIKKETANQKTYQHKIRRFVKLKNYKQIKDSSKKKQSYQKRHSISHENPKRFSYIHQKNSTQCFQFNRCWNISHIITCTPSFYWCFCSPI